METTIELFGITLALGDMATWITGIVTILLFIVTLLQINNERKARNKHEAEAFKKEKVEQAELVSAWIAEEIISADSEDGVAKYWIAISNLSQQPIYQVVVAIAPLSSEGDDLMYRNVSRTAIITIVPPGKGYACIHLEKYKRLGVELAFKDVKGIYWIRKVNGEITEISVPAYEYYGLSLPIGWDELHSEIKRLTQTASSIG